MTNAIQIKLVNAYTVLVMAGKMTIEQVPETKTIGGNEYPIRSEVELLIAEKTIEVLG
jgi:hypothetical protein